MGPPNKVLLPDNLDKEIGDLRRRILALETAGSQASPMPYSESVDASHPYYIDFVIPSGVQPSIAKLSFKFRLYRSTSSFAGGNTGSGNGSGTSGVSAGHSHASAGHTHHNSPTVGAGGAALSINGSTLNMASGPNSGWDTDSTTPGSTGGQSGDHTHTEGSHTHTVGASSLGVGEGTATTITAIGVDGVDKTALLGGGPWNSDTVDLDVSKVLPLGDGLWHTIQLTPAGQGRIVAILKLAV